MNPGIVKKLDCMSPQFLVADLDRSIKFYTETLRFQLNFRYMDFYAGINCNGHSIHLKACEPYTEHQNRKIAEGHVDVTFGVIDIEAVYEEVCRTGAEIVQPLRVMPYGTEFYIADPDRNIIAFFWSEG